MQKPFSALALASILAATITGAAAAQTLHASPGTPAGYSPVKELMLVSSRGLNLSSDDGADLFMRRLSMAVDRACHDRGQNAAPAAFEVCRADAFAQAQTLVRSPLAKRRFAQLRTSRSTQLASRR
jgi:UrcA family protein